MGVSDREYTQQCMEALRTMKRIIVSLMILAAIAGVATAQTTGTTDLIGTVPAILSITVTANATASNLDLSTDQTDLVVGTVVEKSNKKAGYDVTIQSANAGAGASAFFKSADAGNTDTLTYTVKYGGNPVTFSGGSANVSNVTAKTPATGTSNDVSISYTGSTANLTEDTYGDTLTFTITAK